MIFREFIQLRDEFSDLAFRANSFATAAAGADRSIESNNTEFQISGLLCQIDGTNFKVFKKGASDSLTQLYSNALRTLDDHLADVIPESSILVSDLLETASSTGDLYSSIGMITQKYSYSTRISLQDLFYQIDNANQIKSLDYNVTDLKNQLLAVSDNDGYVTNKTWLSVLKEWIEACKNGADESRMELDNTSPTVLSGLYPIIMQGLSAAFSALFTALSLVFGAIFLIIGSAISAFFNIITNAINASGTINPDAINDFCKGPVIGREESLNATVKPLSDLVINTRKVYYCDAANTGLFWWMGENDAKVRMNAYLHPKYSPEALNAMLDAAAGQPLYGVNWIDNNGIITLSRNADANRYIRIDPYMTNEQKSRAETDIYYYCACLCVSELVRWLQSTPYKIWDGNAWQDNSIVWSDHAQTIPHDPSPNKTVSMIKVGFAIMIGLRHRQSDLFAAVSATNVVDCCNEYIKDCFDNRNTFTDLRPHFHWDSFDSTWQGTHILSYQNPLIAGDVRENNPIVEYAGANFARSEDTSITYGWKVDKYYFTFYTAANAIEVDMLPTTCLVEFNSLTSSVLTSALLVTAAITIAGSVVALKVEKALRLKKLKKQFKRSEIIQDKKAIYDDYRNPNRSGGAKSPAEINAALDDYVRAVDKYNRTGRILGWGSYDIKNGWMNDSLSGSSDPTKMSSIIDMFQGDQNNLATKLTSQTSDISTAISNNNENIGSLVSGNNDTLSTLILGEGSNVSSIVSGNNNVLSSLILGEGSSVSSIISLALNKYLFTDNNSIMKQIIALFNGLNIRMNELEKLIK